MEEMKRKYLKEITIISEFNDSGADVLTETEHKAYNVLVHYAIDLEREKLTDHKAVVETLECQLKGFKQQYIDDGRTITRLQNKIEDLENKLQLVRYELKKESDKCYKNNDTFGQKTVGRLCHNLSWELAKGIK